MRKFLLQGFGVLGILILMIALFSNIANAQYNITTVNASSFGDTKTYGGATMAGTGDINVTYNLSSGQQSTDKTGVTGSPSYTYRSVSLIYKKNNNTGAGNLSFTSSSGEYFVCDYSGLGLGIPVLATEMYLAYRAKGTSNDWELPAQGIDIVNTDQVRFSDFTVPTGDWEFALFTTGSALPVTLVRFTGHFDPFGIELEWTTASEENNMGFYVERMTDGNWEWESVSELIPSLSPNGNSQHMLEYSFVDRNFNPGELYYYRLRQIDFNGAFEIHKIIPIKAEEGFSNALAFPNPVKYDLNIRYPEDATSVKLISMDGKTINIGLNTQFNTSHIPGGMYKLMVETPTIIHTQLLIKE